MTENDRMEKLVSLSKRRGFIYQGSGIYGGLAGMWDYGPVGVALKENIKRLWWKRYVEDRSDIYGLDSAILMNSKVWEASGHIKGFTDPLVECMRCEKQFRADHVDGGACPECAGEISDAREFNMMFETAVGAAKDSVSISYLRPETAQGIFVNYKNIVDSFHPTIPFGIAQIGKAFRNEISPRDFIFRAREFEQLELEWFIRESDWKKEFEWWQKDMNEWIRLIGLDAKKVHELEVPHNDRAHYSKRTVDFEYDFPFGRSELYGLAYRANYDLTNHQEHSGVNLSYYDQESDDRFIPHVIEPSLGVDRTVLAVIDSAYTEEEAPTADKKTELRTVLKFTPELAPVKVAILPLMRKTDLKRKALEIYNTVKSEWVVMYDEKGSIGKRYRRQDEIGTPYCITIDFETLEDNAVTVRDRDSMKQDRISISEVDNYLSEKFT